MDCDLLALNRDALLGKLNLINMYKFNHSKLQPRVILIITLLAVLSCIGGRISAQVGLRDFEVQVLGHPAPGYVFMAPVSMDSFGILDHSGKNVYRFANAGTLNLHVQTDGTLLFVNSAKKVVYRMNAQFQIIDTLRFYGAGTFDFHECRMTGKNQYVINGTETRFMDMSKIVPNGKKDASVLGSIIQEVNLSGQILFQWKSLDHIPVSQATDDVDLSQQIIDYIHVNAINLDNDGNFIVSGRNIDQVFKINRTTGDLMWQMGGSAAKKSDFKFVNDTVDGFVGFSHQHDAQRLPNGNLILFDNGNLKPNPYTRAVEYEIDELNRKVKKVWEYRKSPDVFAAATGSVQVLPNNSVLIGWGGTGGRVTAEEVDRDKKIQAVWLAADGTAYGSYRVKKTVFAMTGIDKNISTVGSTEFSNQDSTTHVSLDVRTSTKSTSVIVEHHNYRPFNASFSTSEDAEEVATRWIVRVKEKNALTGNLVFDFSKLPIVISPKNVRLYRRQTEGIGDFTYVPGVYDSVRKTMTIDFAAGEYVPGYLIKLNPVITLPVANSSVNTEAVKFNWTRALEATNYEVVISKNSNFALPIYSTQTTDTSVTYQLDFGTRYYWQVRVKRGNVAGNWVASAFSTGLLSGKQVAPTVTAGVWNGEIPFKWRSSKSANTYHVVISDPLYANITVLDTMVSDTSMLVKRTLKPNKNYNWRVRPERSPVLGDWTRDTLFTVGPPAPFLTLPLEDQVSVSPVEVKIAWNQVEEVRKFRIQLRQLDSTNNIVNSKVQGHSLIVAGLAYGTTYEWRGRSIGKNGAGDWGNWRRFSTAIQTLLLGVPDALSPAGEVLPTNVEFKWTAVKYATSYRIQVSLTDDFSRLEFDREVIADTMSVIQKLSARTNYQWRVRAEFEGVLGFWSDTIMIKTLGTAQALAPISPAIGAENIDVYGEVRYVTGEEYVGYQVELATDSMFTNFTKLDGTENAILFGPLVKGVTYYWRTIGIKTDNSTDTGAVSYFTTEREVISGVNDGVPYDALITTSLNSGSILLETSDVGIRDVECYMYTGELVYSASYPSTTKMVRLDVPNVNSNIIILVVQLGNNQIYRRVVLINR